MRLLLFAYACEPGDGSEPGAGWAWTRVLSDLGETWVVTRANNKEAIEERVAELGNRNPVHFVYVDLPRWARFWKRGQRGIRLYYILWQLVALIRARRLHERCRFDLVWHVTLANAWLGSAAALVRAPFVYGPVGGGVGIPRALVPALGLRGAMVESVRSCARWLGRYLNPLARIAWRRADLILSQNRETVAWLPRRYRAKAEILPNVVLDKPVPVRRDRPAERTMMMAGRLLPWKGGALTIRALAELEGWRLLVFGKGPDERRLRRLADRLGVADRITFRGWVDRPELLRAMHEEADVLMHASLREEAGWVIAEARAAGIPVVALARGGPPLLGARCVPVSGVADTARALAAAAASDVAGEVLDGSWEFDVPRRRAIVTERLVARGLDLVGAQS